MWKYCPSLSCRDRFLDANFVKYEYIDYYIILCFMHSAGHFKVLYVSRYVKSYTDQQQMYLHIAAPLTTRCGCLRTRLRCSEEHYVSVFFCSVCVLRDFWEEMWSHLRFPLLSRKAPFSLPRQFFVGCLWYSSHLSGRTASKREPEEHMVG